VTMTDVTIQLSTPKSKIAHKEPLKVHYEVTNTSSGDVHLVRDNYVLRKQSNTELKVVIGIPPVTVDLDYYRFVQPKTEVLGAGQTRAFDLGLDMPPRDSEIDAKDRLREFEVPLSGDIDLVLELGYGLAPFKVQRQDPLYEFVAWQRFATSNSVRITIAPP